ncbi:MAG TPA: hypothetical protein VKN36_10425 [Eudoraea sp.]|nr:hypothetical protein [Eudoraea sp.]
MEQIKIMKKGRTIKATLLSFERSKRVLIIGPAMGVRSGFYRTIAEHFFALSYSVITFDYYGMLYGQRDVVSEEPKISDWGYKDINMVIEYALERFPTLDIFFLGHSIAGQVFPLAKKSSKIKAVFLVASQNASYQYWKGVSKLKVKFFWYFLLPLAVNMMGYLPGIAYGGKHNLDRSIALDWSRWGRNKVGLLGVEPKAKSRYKNLCSPVKFLSFWDDRMLAPRKAVEQLCNSYGSPNKYHEHVYPEKEGLPEIGHFKFFTKECSSLWHMVDSWFNLVSMN